MQVCKVSSVKGAYFTGCKFHKFSFVLEMTIPTLNYLLSYIRTGTMCLKYFYFSYILLCHTLH